MSITHFYILNYINWEAFQKNEHVNKMLNIVLLLLYTKTELFFTENDLTSSVLKTSRKTNCNQITVYQIYSGGQLDTLSVWNLHQWSRIRSGICNSYQGAFKGVVWLLIVLIIKYIHIVYSMYYYRIGSVKNFITGEFLKAGENILSTTATV